jgi:uncharacterized membrane protein
MNALLAASAAFFLLHLLPATPLRARFIALAGEPVYSAIFSVLSLAAIWWMASSFNAAPYGAKLWTVPGAWLWLKAALILFALILAVAGLATRNPSAPGGVKVLEKGSAAEGIFAITRHPAMWGIAIWATAHMISQATPRGFVFFGALVATALIGSWLQQRRKRVQLPGWPAFQAKTSYWPFAAILEGRATLSLRAIGWLRIAIAVVLWALILHFHAWLFGAPPLPFHV